MVLNMSEVIRASLTPNLVVRAITKRVGKLSWDQEQIYLPGLVLKYLSPTVHMSEFIPESSATLTKMGLRPPMARQSSRRRTVLFPQILRRNVCLKFYPLHSENLTVRSAATATNYQTHGRKDWSPSMSLLWRGLLWCGSMCTNVQWVRNTSATIMYPIIMVITVSSSCCHTPPCSNSSFGPLVGFEIQKSVLSSDPFNLFFKYLLKYTGPWKFPDSQKCDIPDTPWMWQKFKGMVYGDTTARLAL